MSIIQKRIHEAALQLFAQKELADINVSELAQKAGLARNTVYKNLDSIETLFETVATELASEMNERVGRSAAPGWTRRNASPTAFASTSAGPMRNATGAASWCATQPPMPRCRPCGMAHP